MQQARRILKLRPGSGDGATPADPRQLITRAIGRRTRVEAVYNRMRIDLAPHILYTKHDEAYVDGVVLMREGQPPRELKLGSFKLSGLAELIPTARPFDPSSLFDPKLERYEGTLIASVTSPPEA
ncbi:hypothetical protein [Sphingomonas morindae]|uniref:Hedgehog/Intein (Hint) domain-containing protein n=1 Tax=Sphingomonas morindae TaxID=1541170 RepID=A0ABY4X9R7_9SPHN|nr:hypothetical protein [Sphingomonas morindae]USI73707.1 hypothetical protein LHA26_04345 [Sphingomonas morindae]